MKGRLMAAVPRRAKEAMTMQMDSQIRDVLAAWGITWANTVEEIHVILCDARMENTRDHTVTSFLGKVMIDGEMMTAGELWEALQE